MNTLTFETPKHLGDAYGNLIRQVLITSSMAVKPVAYKLADGGNFFTPSADAVDMISFVSKLANLQISVDDSIQLPMILQVSGEGKIMSSQLNRTGIQVTSKDEVLLEYFDNKPINLDIIIDKNSGTVKSEDIRNNLMDKGIDVSSFRTISCRFNNSIVNVSSKEVLDQDIVTIEINSEDKSETKKMRDAIKNIGSVLEEIAKNLHD